MKIHFKIFLLLSFISLNGFAQWYQVGTNIYGEATGDYFGDNNGSAINADGTIVAIGSQHNGDAGEDAGHVRIFEFDGTDWVQMGTDIDGEDLDDHFGTCVSLNGDGTIVAIGAPSADEEFITGHARIYEYDGTDWVQMGTDIDGVVNADFFGASISLNKSGTRVAIGAPGVDDPYGSEGQVRIFEWDGTDWEILGWPINGGTVNNSAGYALELDSAGTTVVIGAPNNDYIDDNAGRVRVYQYEPLLDQWFQLGEDFYGAEAHDRFGHDVSLSANGKIMAVGTPYSDNPGTLNGIVKVFYYEGDIWSGEWFQLGEDIIGETNYLSLGTCVDLSEDGLTFVVGVPGAEDDITDAGAVRVYKYHPGSGWGMVWDNVYGDFESDFNGTSVDITPDGLSFISGASLSDEVGFATGKARVFRMDPCAATSSLIDLTVCDSFVVPSGHETYYVDGTYVDTIANVCGADSIMTFNLSFLYSTTYTIAATGCNSYTVPSGDETYSYAGAFTVYDTLTNALGCDSILTINVFLDKTESFHDVDSCYQYTVPSGDETYYTSGLYTDTLVNSVGCDSVLFLNITINGDSPFTFFAIDTCNAYTLPSGDTTYYDWSGWVYDTLSNVYGCDSVLIITLTVTPTSYATETLSVCDSFTVASGDETYYETGTYYDTLTSIAGCDSVITYHLNFNYSSYTTFSTVGCDSYTVPSGDETYMESGVYYDTIPTVTGCDSIMEIMLTIEPTYEYAETLRVCWGTEHVFHDGFTTISEGSFWHTSHLISSSGCDSIIDSWLVSYNLDSTVTVTEDYIKSNNTTAWGADFDWWKCEDGEPATAVGGSGQSFYPDEPGWYAVTVTWTTVPCSVTSECVWWGPDMSGIDEESLHFNLYPNPTDGRIFLSIPNGTDAQINLYDVQGKRYSAGFVSKLTGGTYEIDLSTLEAGVYLVAIEVDGQVEIHKVTKH